MAAEVKDESPAKKEKFSRFIQEDDQEDDQEVDKRAKYPEFLGLVGQPFGSKYSRFKPEK